MRFCNGELPIKGVRIRLMLTSDLKLTLGVRFFDTVVEASGHQSLALFLNYVILI